MKKLLITSILLTILGVLVVIYGAINRFFPATHWKASLENNKAIGPFRAYQNISTEKLTTHHYAVLSSVNAICRSYINPSDEQRKLVDPTSHLDTAGPIGHGYDITVRPRQEDLQGINRFNQTWQWVGVGNIKSGKKVTCTDDFFVVEYPQSPFIVSMTRNSGTTLGFLLAGTGIVLLIAYFKRKKNPQSPELKVVEKNMQFSVNYASNGIAQGGRLYILKDRLHYEPHAIESVVTQMTKIEIPFTEITSVGVAPRTGNLADGGMRKRLQINTKSNQVHLFVVNGLNKKVALIQATIQKYTESARPTDTNNKL